MTERSLAFIGLGAMGGGIAQRLIDTGHRLTVYNRTAEKAAPLAERGATVVDSPAAAATGHDVVLLSLSDDEAVEKVLFGEILAVAQPGTTIIDTSAVSPGYARDSERRLAGHGLFRVETAVVGNPEMARTGKLRVITAGSEQRVRPVRSVLEALGEHASHAGPTGSASVLKLCYNLLLGAQTLALSEAIAFGTAAGLDRDALIEMLVASGFSSPVLRFRASFMRSGTYQPAAFRTSLMVKDLRNILAEAASYGRQLPTTEQISGRFQEAVAAGGGDSDAAVVSVLLDGPKDSQ